PVGAPPCTNRRRTCLAPSGAPSRSATAPPTNTSSSACDHPRGRSRRANRDRRLSGESSAVQQLDNLRDRFLTALLADQTRGLPWAAVSVPTRHRSDHRGCDRGEDGTSLALLQRTTDAARFILGQ